MECPPAWLSVSPVLEGAVTGHKDDALHDGSSDEECSLPLLTDTLEEWQLLIPFITAASDPLNSTATSLDIDFRTAAVVLKIADKYNMVAVCDMVEGFLASDKAQYSEAPIESGDPASIWHWLQLSSRLSQPSLLALFKSRIIAQRLVPTSASDVSGLHPTDLTELLLALLKENAAVRYKCLGCAGRHSTEVRLCGRCSFSPHIRL